MKRNNRHMKGKEMVQNEYNSWESSRSTEGEDMCGLIEEIPGLECLTVWRRDEQYHCVVRTDRVDLKRVCNEIRTLVENRKNIEIRENNIHFSMKPSQLEAPKARVELLSVRTQSTHGRFGVDVTLRYLENESTGHAEGGQDVEERLRTSGEATREALANLIPRGGNIAIKEIERVNAKKREIILALVTLTYRGEKIHCGAALNRVSDCEAVVRATLDAVNRYIDTLMQE
jgi:hypothetical protein